MNLLALFWLEFFTLGLAFSLVMAYRNSRVYACRIAAINMASSAARRIIREGDGWKDCYELLHEYGTYHQMMWALMKWRFTDFYPMLEERLAMLEGEYSLA